MKKITNILLLLSVVLAACSEKELSPISSGSGKPEKVVVVSVENTSGGATISYSIPKSDELMLIKAVYTLSNGQERYVISSKYENFVKLNGFNDEQTHEIRLIALNVGMQESDPVSVQIQPLKSPLKLTSESIKIRSDFGGARFEWVNPEQAPLNIEFYAADDKGELQLSNVFSTSSLAMYQSLRGYEPDKRIFAAIVSDTYGNTSDTIFAEGKYILPMEEIKTDKKGMKMMYLDGDGNFNQWDSYDYSMFDDNVSTFAHSSAPPNVFTFDLGRLVKLSRFKIWNREYQGSGYYVQGNLKVFNIYGKLETPSKDGNWGEWTLLRECEEIKPSGSAIGTETTEDVEFAKAGFEFEIDFDMPTVRYLRFSVAKTWGGPSWSHPAEFTFWGQYVD